MTMNNDGLRINVTGGQHNERMNLRNHYLSATQKELQTAIDHYAMKADWFAVACLLELGQDD